MYLSFKYFLIIVIAAMLSACASKAQEQNDYVEEDIKETQTVVAVPLPDTLTFAGEPVPLDDPDVRERLDEQLTLTAFRHSSTLMLIRKESRWRGLILEILKEEGIPEDFFYLAVAESGLDNAAKSYRGAMGMWQFMRETAESFDLEASKNSDLRKDPVLATRAACRYLKEAHSKFGNWTSVAASYNRGMGGLAEAFEEQRVSSYYDLYLNKETYRYIFRILALKLILEKPYDYGYCVDANMKYAPFEYKELEISETIEHLPSFAKKYNLNYKTLKIYNPWLNSYTYKLEVNKGKKYTLRLPKDAKLNTDAEGGNTSPEKESKEGE